MTRRRFGYNAFSLTFKHVRQQRQVTLRRLSDLLGIPHLSLHNAENNTHKPSMDTLIALCDWMGVKLEAFVIKESEAHLEDNWTGQSVEAFLKEVQK